MITFLEGSIVLYFIKIINNPHIEVWCISENIVQKEVYLIQNLGVDHLTFDGGGGVGARQLWIKK